MSISAQLTVELCLVDGDEDGGTHLAGVALEEVDLLRVGPLVGEVGSGRVVLSQRHEGLKTCQFQAPPLAESQLTATCCSGW